MRNVVENKKRAEITMSLSEFEIPPMQDALIVGNNAPIGPEAARRMVDALSPNQYEIIRIEHSVIEAIVIRKTLMNMLDKEKLVKIILDEGERIVDASTIIKAQIDIVLHVSKSVDL